MADFIDLPDLILRLVISYLPVWKLPILALLCRKLCGLVQSDYQTRRHMRLFCGMYCDKFNFPECAEHRIMNLPDQFDLVLRFEGGHRVNRVHSNYTITPDLELRNVAKMAACLPNITHLTLVIVNEFPVGYDNELLLKWPGLISLKIINRCGYFLDWRHVATVLRRKERLEHFMFHSWVGELRDSVEHFDEFIWRGKLKTYINRDYPVYNPVRVDGKMCYIANRTIWNYPKSALAIDKFETFGVYDYKISPDADFNVELLRKMKQVHVSGCLNTNTLRQVNLNNWTALRFMALEFENVCFSQLFAMLSVLTNLEELNVEVMKVELPKSRICKLWTRLPSVRRFRLMSQLDAHEFHKVANCVPNATDCSLQLLAPNNAENDGPDRYYKRLQTKHGLELCKKCEAVVKRAIEKYTSDINAFVWFRQIGEDGKESMVPTVRLFTEDVGGTTRFNTRFIPIDRSV